MVRIVRALLDVAILAGVLVGSFICVGGAVLGGFVPFFDAVNHFQLLFFVAALLAMVATFVWPYHLPSFKPVAQIALLVSLAASLFMLGPDIVRRLSASALSEQQLRAQNVSPFRVMSFNIYLGTWDGEGVLRSVRQHRPDIVALQEYPPKRFRRHSGLKQEFPYQARCGYWRRCTLGILSKHPMDEIKRYDLGSPKLVNPMHGKMLAATVRPKGKKPFRFYNLHLSWPLPVEEKRTQLAAMARILKEEANRYPRQVIAGDFNSTGWAYRLDAYVTEAGLMRRSQFVPSFPSPHSRIKGILKLPAFLSLDHILTSPDLQTGPVVRAKASLGDHWPIITDVYLPNR